MAAIGSLVFCTDCGNLLEPNAGRKAYLQCDICGTQNKGTQHSRHGKLAGRRNDIEAFGIPIDTPDEASFECPGNCRFGKAD
ncbi:DNA-directed RNA polymerase I core subunit rpa12 [Teratosphaeriaceae sp. CCFEE 6253]|nr:DNA-directed RNA polymerase I core subunit rpa12 [Teratosphaeriaceae sp. CCFEE 6253]